MNVVILAFIKTLAKEIAPLFLNWLTRRRFFLAFSSLFLVLASAVIFGSSYIFEDQKLTIELEKRVAEEIVTSTVKKCGNGTAISLSLISNTPNVDAFGNKTFDGIFHIAYAMEKDHLVDLIKEDPDLYKPTYYISESFYNFLRSLDADQSTPPISFQLDSNRQYQETPYFFINTFLPKTSWGKEGKLKKLYITSVVLKNPFKLEDQLIYGITFIKSTDFVPSTRCDEVITDLRILKNRIKNL